MSKITPDYLNIDFNTLVSKIKSELQSSEEFKDYNYAGSNISILIELCSYIGELNTFYLNQISKNILPGDVEIYEPASKQAQLGGYSPLGPLSSEVLLEVTVDSGINENDQVVINEGTTIFNDDNVPFVSLDTYSFDTSGAGPYHFQIPLVQGEIREVQYRGSDLVDDKIILPFTQYAHNKDVPVIKVWVNGEEWDRVFDVFELISPIESTNKVYQYQFNEYQNHIVQFSQSRKVPKKTDDIEIQVIFTLGPDGNVGPNSFSDVPVGFLRNTTQDIDVPIESISIANLSSTGGLNPEGIEEIVSGYTSNLHSQLRNVTKRDYIGHLKQHPQIINGNAYGEAEKTQGQGDPQEYNRTYLQVIPHFWDTSTIETSGYEWTESPSVSGYIEIPYSINPDFETEILDWTAERKMLNVYESVVLPELVYFGFQIGIRVKATSNFTLVTEDLKRKLGFFFHPKHREFGEKINFLDIENFLMDSSISDGEDNFSQLQGIRNLVIRDIYAHTGINPIGSSVFPKYTEEILDVNNTLLGIQLRYDQFPAVSLEHLSFRVEK